MTLQKNRLVWFGLASSAVAGTAAYASPAWMLGGLLAGGVTWMAWGFAGCRHPRPLALLPPVRNAAGLKQPAHWFCSACGRSWPADIEHANPPVARFVGHDETKAVDAARRAAELEVRNRELAVQRAGMAGQAPTARRRQGPVPIRPRRAAG